MRTIEAAGALALALLTACASGMSSGTKSALVNVACNLDKAAAGPVLQVVADLGNTGAAVVTADQLLVHPQVVAACAKYGGTPGNATLAPATPATGKPIS